MRIAYLGPAGTFTEDALRRGDPSGEFEPLRTATIHDAILAVERGEAERALVPFENSIEGSVRGTLDTLAFDAEAVTIVGEHDYAVRAHLIAREGVELERGRGGPLPPAAAGPVRPLPARAAGRGRTAQRQQHRGGGADGRRVGPALGGDRLPRRRRSSTAATILREGIQDEADNVTRFVWIAPAGTEPAGGGPWKTSLVFSELGEDHPGALVNALREFSDRDDQPHPDRVAAAAQRPRPLHVLLRPRGRRGRRRRRRGDRGAARQGRIGPVLGSYPVG